MFPRGVRVAVEPRHTSWFTEDLRRLLTSRGAALCLADRRGPITPIWRTADWTYIRFHAGRATPSPCYGERALEHMGDESRRRLGTKRRRLRLLQQRSPWLRAARCSDVRQAARGQQRRNGTAARCRGPGPCRSGGRPTLEPVSCRCNNATVAPYRRETGACATVCERRRRSGEWRPSLDPVPVVLTLRGRVPSCLVRPRFRRCVRPASGHKEMPAPLGPASRTFKRAR